MDSLYNFVTMQFDDVGDIPEDDEFAMQYIPQDAFIQNLFKGYRLMGKSVAEAMGAALEAYAALSKALSEPLQ